MRDMIERLVRIETKLDNYESLREKQMLPKIKQMLLMH